MRVKEMPTQLNELGAVHNVIGCHVRLKIEIVLPRFFADQLKLLLSIGISLPRFLKNAARTGTCLQLDSQHLAPLKTAPALHFPQETLVA